jgi:hypothetical protein
MSSSLSATRVVYHDKRWIAPGLPQAHTGHGMGLSHPGGSILAMPETDSDYAVDEPGYRQWKGGREPMCTLEVDGATREGYIRAVDLRPESDPPGWWAFVQWRDEKGYQRIDWFNKEQHDVTVVPEP